MRKILFVGLLFILGCYTPKNTINYTQYDLRLPLKNNKIFFEKIYSFSNLSKNDLFKRGRIWAVDYFINAKNVLQISDKEAGQLAGKGIIDLGTSNYDMGYSNMLKFTFNIQYKNNKYRVQFYDFILTATNTVNHSSISSPMEKIYFHYYEGKMNKAVIESRNNMKQRYARYIYGLKMNLRLMNKFLYNYEIGKHTTSF